MNSGAELPCPHYPDCVGCPLIGRPYGEQLRRKRERVREALHRYAPLENIEVGEVAGSSLVFGYRSQAKLAVRRARRGLLLGIYRPGSHQIVDIRRCVVHHPLIERILEALASAVDRLDVPAYDERNRTGSLRYVVVRIGVWSRTAQVILVTATPVLPRARELVGALRRVRGVVSVVQNINPDPGNVILAPLHVPLTRQEALVEKIGPFKLRTRPGTFLQANIPVARKLYRHVVARLEPESKDIAVDLYCGAGALAFHLAMAARLVVGVEESDTAVNDARANVRLNGVGNARFRAGDVATVFPELCRQMGRIDIVTLNPPRRGADEPARSAIVAAHPRRIGYVSCDPDTLARDLDWFVRRGYAVTDVQPFDLLPQTDHVECVATLAASAA